MASSTLKYLGLAALQAVGFYGTWGRNIKYGGQDLLNSALANPQFNLPGTKSTLLFDITGYRGMDDLLRTFVLIFWDVVAGTVPSSSLSNFYFAGQIIGLAAIMYMEQYRVGNAGVKFNATLWFMIFQLLSAALANPSYLLNFLLASPLVRGLPKEQFRDAVTFSNPSIVSFLPFTILLSFVGSLVAMVLPSPTIVSTKFQQYAILVWNAFPVWILIMQLVISQVVGGSHTSQSKAAARSASLKTSRFVYATTMVVTFAFHIATLSVSITALLFPIVFASGYAEKFHPRQLVPPLAEASFETVGEAWHDFLRWDLFVASLFGLLFAAANLHAARKSMGASKKALAVGNLSAGFAVPVVIGLSVLLGPITVAMAMFWIRDELVLGDEEMVASQKKSN